MNRLESLFKAPTPNPTDECTGTARPYDCRDPTQSVRFRPLRGRWLKDKHGRERRRWVTPDLGAAGLTLDDLEFEGGLPSGLISLWSARRLATATPCARTDDDLLPALKVGLSWEPCSYAVEEHQTRVGGRWTWIVS